MAAFPGTDGQTGRNPACFYVSEVQPPFQSGEQDEGPVPGLRVQAPGRVMSDFSFSVRCPYCGGRFAPDDGSCCEPPEEEGEEEAGQDVGPDDGLGSEPFALAREED